MEDQKQFKNLEHKKLKKAWDKIEFLTVQEKNEISIDKQLNFE